MDYAAFLGDSKRFGRILIVLGLALGIGATGWALDGDAQGRVNLFWLLLLFVFFPVLSLALSLYALQPLGFQVNWLPWLLVPFNWIPGVDRVRAALVQVSSKGYGRCWFVYQAQIFYMAFSIACALTYLLKLTFFHVPIVWSSTLLEARHFLPPLQLLAWPWSFWDDAQPNMELLRCTATFLPSCSEWHWWRYVFAALLCYNLIPRCLLFLGAWGLFRWQFKKDEQSREQRPVAPAVQRPSAPPSQAPAQEAATLHSLASPYLLVVWGKAPEFVRQHVESEWGPPLKTLESDGLDPAAQDWQAESLVILAKSAEPPMMALKDFMQRLPSLPCRALLPLDWKDQQMQPVVPADLEDWRRACANAPGNWSLLQAPEGG